jgi:hypothetical protein
MMSGMSGKGFLNRSGGSGLAKEAVESETDPSSEGESDIGDETDPKVPA